MKMWSGKHCKGKCAAYNTALAVAEQQRKQCKELALPVQCYESILSLQREGYVLIGLQKTEFYDVATVLSHDGGKYRKVRLYALPYSKFSRPLCDMDIAFNIEAHNAYIEDWHCERENEGIGSILMANLLAFLKASGFYYLTGEISFVDFDHEDKLRHFYSKFGFEITNCSQSRHLKLSLQ